jgi:hypothetical protein
MCIGRDIYAIVMHDCPFSEPAVKEPPPNVRISFSALHGGRISRQHFSEEGLLTPDAADIRLSGSSRKVCVCLKTAIADLPLTLTIMNRSPLFRHQRRKVEWNGFGSPEDLRSQIMPPFPPFLPRFSARFIDCETPQLHYRSNNHDCRPRSLSGNRYLFESTLVVPVHSAGRPNGWMRSLLSVLGSVRRRSRPLHSRISNASGFEEQF